jgi:hypothetical protein
MWGKTNPYAPAVARKMVQRHFPDMNAYEAELFLWDWTSFPFGAPARWEAQTVEYKARASHALHKDEEERP